MRENYGLSGNAPVCCMCGWHRMQAVNSLALPRSETPDLADSTKQSKVRVQIIRHARTHSVGKIPVVHV